MLSAGTVKLRHQADSDTQHVGPRRRSTTISCGSITPIFVNLTIPWRAKQLQYSLLRSLMGRHKDFWLVTEDALVYASKSLRLDLTQAKREQLMQAYLTLAAFPDVKPGLEALKRRGLRLAILSNGEPRMLEAAATSAGIDTLLDTIISVEEIKIFKVSPRVYSLGLERLQASRTTMGFVSSNSWDINGARSAGLTTFWMQRTPGEPPEELGFAANRVVRAITDLAPLVRGIGRLRRSPGWSARSLPDPGVLLEGHGPGLSRDPIVI